MNQIFETIDKSLRKPLNENVDVESEAKQVNVVKETHVRDCWVCPHCDQKIQEKSIFSPDDGDTFYHSLCGKRIILP